MKRKTIILSGLAIAVLGIAALATPALAHGPFGFGGANRGEKLAESLGISIEELQAAQDQAFDSSVAEAVESGRLTAEQADLMIAQRNLKRSIDQEAIMAEALGVGADELEAAREAGTLRELYDSLEIDQATIHERMQAAQEAAIATAVQEGVITAEQAEALQNTDGKLGGCMGGMRGMNGMHGMPGMRGMHGMPGMRGMRGGAIESRGAIFLRRGGGFGHGFDSAPGFAQPAPVNSTNL